VLLATRTHPRPGLGSARPAWIAVIFLANLKDKLENFKEDNSKHKVPQKLVECPICPGLRTCCLDEAC
jgi:DNA-binding helix-hairpin-helix protein with protein kinase domain